MNETIKNQRRDKQKQETLDALVIASLWLIFALVAIPLIAIAFRVAAWILGVL